MVLFALKKMRIKTEAATGGAMLGKAWGLQPSLKRDSGTGVFLRIFEIS